MRLFLISFLIIVLSGCMAKTATQPVYVDLNNSHNVTITIHQEDSQAKPIDILRDLKATVPSSL